MKKLAAALALGVLACTASAAPVTVEYTFRIEHLAESLAGTSNFTPVQSSDLHGFNIAIGQTAKGYLTYDSEGWLNLDSLPWQEDYRYNGTLSNMIRFENGAAAGPMTHEATMRVHDSWTVDNYWIEGSSGSSWDVPTSRAYVQFADTAHPGYLAPFVPSADTWSSVTPGGRVSYDYWTGNDTANSLWLSGTPVSFRVVSSVPEPTAALMLLAGIPLLLRRRRVSAR